ncbi:MAG: recombination-associated protein RdgC [Pseudomonadota bacterium]
MPFFRNLRVYRLNQWPAPDDATLAEQLEAQALKPCGRLEPASIGWTSPYGRDDERLAHTANGCHLLRFGVNERVLPTAVLKEAVAERASAFRERTGSKPNRRQQVTLRDEVMMELLPQAFIKPAHTDCYLDPKGEWLVVDAASAKRADEIATLLRQSIDGTRLTVIDAANRIQTHLTHWLSQGQCPDELAFSDECDLRDDEDARSTVKCRHQDLETQEVRQHIDAGKRVVKLGLCWNERLSFSVSEDFALTRVRPEDILSEQFEDLPADDDLQRMDAEFVFMTLEYRALLNSLETALELDSE